MSNLYDVLEICLNELEQGAEVDTVLFRHPEFADELRPILNASVEARKLSVPAPSAEVVRRSRARVMQKAAEMREAKAAPVFTRRLWSVPLRRAFVTLLVVTLLFVSGTNLVRAASSTLPGDQLYPVKRTWEDVLVFFTFDPQARQSLELAHENERLRELDDLFQEGRSTEVEFSGYITGQITNGWQVANISVVVLPQTELPAEPLVLGAPVKVKGQTQTEGVVLAEKIERLPSGSKLPDVINNNDNDGSGAEDHEGSGSSSGQNTNSELEDEAPSVEATRTPRPQSEQKQDSFNGILQSMDEKNQIWTINGVRADVSAAEIKGMPVIGASAKVEGYFASNGVFIVTKIEFSESGSSGGSNVNDDGKNENKDDSKTNTNSNTNDDHGGNSGSGSGSNSNSNNDD